MNPKTNKGYQEGLPELPSDLSDIWYYWRPATPEDKISFLDRAGNSWVIDYKWIWYSGGVEHPVQA